MIFKPHRLAGEAIPEDALAADKKACARFGPCGVGERALYLNSFFLDRRYIGLATLLNLFLLGYIVEFSEFALARLFGEPNLAGRIAFLLTGVPVTCLAAALYYSADLGVSTYDAIPLHIASRKPRLFGRVLPFKAVRVIADLICVIIGVALGARAGLGTIITALFMGPLIAFFRKFTDPMAGRN